MFYLLCSNLNIIKKINLKNMQDPFIAILKENLKSNNTYKNKEVQRNNDIKINRNVNELLNDEELGKKIGKMEATLNYYETKLNNEFNERKILEEKIESLTSDVNDIRSMFDNFSKLFSDSFSKIKTNILENVDSKSNSLNKIVCESAKRINVLEDIILNNNSPNNNPNTNHNNSCINQKSSFIMNDNMLSNKSASNSILFSTERESYLLKQSSPYLNLGKLEILSRKVSQIEALVCKRANYPGREEEINTTITKMNHMEKQFELFLENYSKDNTAFKNILTKCLKNYENLTSYYEVLNEKYDNLYKNFNDTNININKFNYQTTILLNETQKKLEEYADDFNNTKNDLKKSENDLINEYSLLKEVISKKIDEFDKGLKEFRNKMDLDIVDFKKGVEEKQQKFINFIQTENNNFLHETKNVQNKIEEQCSEIQKNNIVLNRTIDETKNNFFHNLNEIEQYFNKKYQNICKLINMKES